MTCIGPYKRLRVCLFGRKRDGTRICVRCGSLGPARDTPAVMIEIRAAEIADEGRFVRCLDTEAMEWDCEQCGWEEYNANDYVQPTGTWFAGYLARCIVEHEDEP